MIQSSPVNIPAITILVRPSKYFDKFSASTNSLLNSVKMTFDITKMCCFPLNNCEGQVLWEQSSATASITQTSPYLSMGCCALHSVHRSPHEDKRWGTSTWLGQRKVIWHVGSTMLECQSHAHVWFSATEAASLLTWVRQLRSTVCHLKGSTTRKTGTHQLRWAQPYCLVCIQCSGGSLPKSTPKIGDGSQSWSR